MRTAARFSGLDRGALRPIVPLLLLLAVYLLPWLTNAQSFRLTEYEEIISFIVAVIALNIAMGFAGQYVIGITAVFMIGGYAAALATLHHPKVIGLTAMCVLGAVFGGVVGLVIGLPSLRIGGFYLALVSLFWAVVVPTVVQNWSLVGGQAGIAFFAVLDFNPKLTGDTLYLIYVSMALVATLFSWALLHSVVGRKFLALHASEHLSVAVGIAAYRTKLLAVFISAVLAGVAGAMYVYSQQFISPTSATSDTATLLLAALVIGGMGTVTGPIVGGALILGVNLLLTGLQNTTDIIFGVVLLVFVVLMPDGVLAQGAALNRRLGIRRTTRSMARAPEAPKYDADEPSSPLTAAPRSHRGALHVIGVRRAFGGVVAVQGVNLTVEPGTVHGLIGSNGSGKTTLLNLISGYYRLDEGEIRLGDDRISRSPTVVARLGVARTFQSPKLMLHESALDNVIVGAEMWKRASGPESVLRLPRGRRAAREAREVAMNALASLGLEHIASDEAQSLPHGTRRLVELARAIAMRPAFIMLDEPAAGLSPLELDTLIGVIGRLARLGVGILLIEHNVPMVLRLAEQVTVLHQGECLFQGTPGELREDREVASAFLGADTSAIEVADGI
jgi:branched-chain amino acid transport system permease protein